MDYAKNGGYSASPQFHPERKLNMPEKKSSIYADCAKGFEEAPGHFS